jgi:hypothetical protein
MISANALANGMTQDSQVSLTLASLAAGTVALLPATAPDSAAENQADNALGIAVS